MHAIRQKLVGDTLVGLEFNQDVSLDRSAVL
jgi:hypothetical protein